MSDLLGKPALNIPLLVDIRFSKKVAELNASCFDLVNINNLNIIGFNPYFVVHAFPHDEGLCSIQLKERELCLLPLSCFRLCSDGFQNGNLPRHRPNRRVL